MPTSAQIGSADLLRAGRTAYVGARRRGLRMLTPSLAASHRMRDGGLTTRRHRSILQSYEVMADAGGTEEGTTPEAEELFYDAEEELAKRDTEEGIPVGPNTNEDNQANFSKNDDQDEGEKLAKNSVGKESGCIGDGKSEIKACIKDSGECGGGANEEAKEKDSGENSDRSQAKEDAEKNRDTFEKTAENNIGLHAVEARATEATGDESKKTAEENNGVGSEFRNSSKRIGDIGGGSDAVEDMSSWTKKPSKQNKSEGGDGGGATRDSIGGGGGDKAREVAKDGVGSGWDEQETSGGGGGGGRGASGSGSGSGGGAREGASGGGGGVDRAVSGSGAGRGASCGGGDGLDEAGKGASGGGVDGTGEGASGGGVVDGAGEGASGDGGYAKPASKIASSDKETKVSLTCYSTLHYLLAQGKNNTELAK